MANSPFKPRPRRCPSPASVAVPPFSRSGITKTAELLRLNHFVKIKQGHRCAFVWGGVRNKAAGHKRAPASVRHDVSLGPDVVHGTGDR